MRLICLEEEQLKEILMSYFDIGDSDTYQLTRVKKAFSVGTMTLDDFVEWDEKQIDDLIKYIKNKTGLMSYCRLIDASKFDVFRYDDSIIKQYGNTFDSGVEYVLNQIDLAPTIFLTEKENYEYIDTGYGNAER